MARKAAPADSWSPMSAVQEVQVIEGLVQSFEARRPVAAPMSGVQELELIEELVQSFDAEAPAPAPSPSGATHRYQ